MIKYSNSQDLRSFIFRLCRLRGDVFRPSFAAAFPVALGTCGVKVLMEHGYMSFLDTDILANSSIWSGFIYVVGFLVLFRTSQAYTRFWDGITALHLMRTHWFMACSQAIALLKYSKVDKDKVIAFKHTIVRFTSMLNAVALAEIEDNESGNLRDIHAFKYEVWDVASVEPRYMKAVQRSHAKVALVYQWLQQIIVEGAEAGVLSMPPPLLAHVFQNLTQGLTQFNLAHQISEIPFPFPYAQACDWLLTMHALVTPFVVAQWANSPMWGAVFSFIQVFTLWCLRNIAMQIENPFGQDENDIEAAVLQSDLNQLLSTAASEDALTTPSCVCAPPQSPSMSMAHIWVSLDNSVELDEKFSLKAPRDPEEEDTAGTCCGKQLPRARRKPKQKMRTPSHSATLAKQLGRISEASRESDGDLLPVSATSSDAGREGLNVTFKDLLPVSATSSDAGSEGLGSPGDRGGPVQSAYTTAALATQMC